MLQYLKYLVCFRESMHETVYFLMFGIASSAGLSLNMHIIDTIYYTTKAKPAQIITKIEL